MSKQVNDKDIKKCPKCNFKKLHLEYNSGRHYEGSYYIRKCKCRYIDKVHTRNIIYDRRVKK